MRRLQPCSCFCQVPPTAGGGGSAWGLRVACRWYSRPTRPADALSPPLQSSHDVAELRRVCDVMYRSSTVRERLCQAIHEPSAELALRHLGEFAEDPAVLRRPEWTAAFLAAPDLVHKVDMVLERLVQWHTARKAPKKVVMAEPWDWYPKARLMRRTFIFHHGATNSGKTHAALEALTRARSGVYCAPLKALAGQVWSRINASVPCDLLIGDERRFGGAAEHVSCTVEMTPIDLQVDVGVIDEIQMIGDRDRGWAWTRALLGLPAREIHLCGEERAITLVENLLYKTFERGRLSRQEHKRLVPLQPCETLRGDIANVENGDCLVCFSRNAVMDLHNELRHLDNVHSSYIYGAMPFEVREKQAATFNSGVREVIEQAKHPANGRAGRGRRHVLVSTDAIAYGLNMNIERVIFTTMRKFDGKSMVDVPAPTVKQICGRAGRYGLVRQNASGYYTSLHDGEDQEKLQAAMKANTPNLTRAGLLPTADILQLYVELTERRRKTRNGNAPRSSGGDGDDAPFSSLMQSFAASCESTSLFFPCDLTRSLLKIAKLLDAVPALSLKDRILFCYLPLSDSSDESMSLIVAYAQEHAEGKSPVALRINDKFHHLVNGRRYKDLVWHVQNGRAQRDERVEHERQRCLSRLERLYRQAEMYCWLSWRFQTTFTQREEGTALKHAVAQEMEALVL